MNIKNIEAYYSSDPDWKDEFKNFNKLKKKPSLKKLLADANRLLPASHDEGHVVKMIEIIDSLFNEECYIKFDIIDVFDILAAIYIHDIGMIHMITAGSNYNEARRNHSNINIIRQIIKKKSIFENIYNESRINRIILIASSHSDDIDKTVEDKINEIRNDNDRNDASKNKLIALIRLICITDYLDLGIDRLRSNVDLIEWDEKQKEHIKKHELIIPPNISGDIIIVTLTDDAKEIVKNNIEKLQLRLEILSVLQKVFYELEKHIIKLNNALETQWFLKPLNEDFFGKLFPLSYGIQLHSTIFEKAVSEHTRKNQFQIDMLGHSLFARFVNNEEKLNNKILEILKNEETQIRILLLDPDTELQQSCEIYDSQSGENRSILPLYDNDFKLVEKAKGDILLSLDKIDKNWQNVGVKSCLIVKLTKKILYASITRYGDYMIVTPYTMGLFNQSISIVYSRKSPVYDALQKDFELLWNKKDETRLFLRKIGDNVPNDNPIKDIILDDKQKNNQSNFNYENWLLRDDVLKERIRFWFEHENVIIPPYELEIQPTNICNLKCTHCIGRHLDYLDLEKSTLKISDIDRIKTLLGVWNKNNEFRIERIRISGLNGDPLSDAALEFTKALIARNDTEFKREIVLFTNGLNIYKAIDDLLKIDSVHISIDAGTKETFEEIKGNDSFGIIIKNIEVLKAKKLLSKSKTKIGIGFVITQRNYSEVDQILKLINDIGVDFIRFKRDIHLPNSISWRTWIETKNKIDKIIDNKIKRNKDNYPTIDNIYLTDLPRQHWNGNTEKCISHKFCLTIGADKNIYTCDHLTSKSYTAIANLSDSRLIDTITQSLKDKKYCDKLKNCSQCPPFNFRFNYFIPQLKTLYNGNWANFDNKIAEYFKNNKVESN